MPSIDDLRGLGYEVGIAHGSVQAEEEALAEAHATRQPASLATSAAEVTAATVKQLDAEGKLPDTAEARQELATRIAEAALEQLTERADERVAFHEQALAIAKAMPTVYVLSGEGFTNIYLAIDDETGEAADPIGEELVTALKDPEGIAERRWQHRLQRNAKGDEILAAVARLRQNGYTVTPTLQEDGTGFQANIAGGGTEASASTLPQLRAAARDLPKIGDPK